MRCGVAGASRSRYGHSSRVLGGNNTECVVGASARPSSDTVPSSLFVPYCAACVMQGKRDIVVGRDEDYLDGGRHGKAWRCIPADFSPAL